MASEIDYYASWETFINSVERTREDDCGKCFDCLSTRKLPSGLPLTASMMVVCPDCGNKRCPKSTHHDNECSKSNDPGQTGSRYA